MPTKPPLNLEEGKFKMSARSVKGFSISGGVLKENVQLSSSGSSLLPKKPSTKSMGFLEMKRMNQELVSEIDAVHERLRLSESEYQDTITQLAQEIMQHKEQQNLFKSEIKHYQDCLTTKSGEVEALQSSLEEIKLENDRLAAVLEGAKLDAATGLRIEQSTDFTNHRHKLEVDLDQQHKALDDIISNLESSLLDLQ